MLGLRLTEKLGKFGVIVLLGVLRVLLAFPCAFGETVERTVEVIVLVRNADDAMPYVAVSDGERLVSCTILTTTAPKELSWLHERMPVMMNHDHYDLWLNRSTPDIAGLTKLLRPYTAAELAVYLVTLRVNRAGTDEPVLLEPVSDACA